MSIKGVLGTACALVVAVSVAFAGDAKQDPAKHAGMPAEQMQQMKEAMAKCDVCRYMAAHLDELMPVMKTDVVKLNDGVAIMHHVTDPQKLAVFRAAEAEMAKAGESCMTMTDEQAKTQLCAYCQEVRQVVKAGGNMSTGDTRNGDMTVLTSKDAAVQKRIENVASMCEMSAGT